jgi:cation:H+ antiporter
VNALNILEFENLPLWANSLSVLASIAVIGRSAHEVVGRAWRIAKRMGISELVVGLTVVALGTSLPELAVTLLAAFEGRGDISVGNIVGSNIFNLGFILGATALVRAVPTSRPLLWRDGTVLVLTTFLLLALLGSDLELGKGDGAILLGGLVAYLLLVAVTCRPGWLETEPEEGRGEPVDAPSADGPGVLLKDAAVLTGGLALVVAGSHLLVNSAAAMARDFGVSEWVIGVTIVAAGTSAPEFATSLAGVLRGRYGISIGNVVGSDIFNLLGVLGVAGLLRPVVIDQAATHSLMALAAMVVMVFVFIRTGWRISRVEGLVLLLAAMARWTLDLAARSAPWSGP